MRVLYVYNTPRQGILDSYRSGKGPDDFLYGLNHMPHFGIRAEFSDRGHNKVISRLSFPFKAGVSRLIRMGFELDQALLLLPKMNEYDALVTTVDHSGFPVSILKCMSLVRTPQVYISMMLANSLRMARNSTLIHFYRRIVSKAEAIITLSEVEAASITQVLRIPGERVRAVPFGVDTEFFKPMRTEPGDYIMTMGKNAARDYDTLFRAISGLDTRLIASASRSNTQGLRIPDNADVYLSFLPYIKLKEIIAKAKFTVIPMIETELPVGHSSILDIMAMGKALILSKISSLFDTGLRDGENCLFARPGDANDMREKMQYLLDNPSEANRIGRNARRFVEKRHASENYAKGIAAVLKQVHSGSMRR